MHVRRVGPDSDSFNGIYRIVTPGGAWSCRLWFDKSRAERAARRWRAERAQQTLFRDG